MAQSDRGGASRRRIAMVTGEYPPDEGGVADYTALLAQGLSGAGWSVSVIVGSDSAAASARGSTGRRRGDSNPDRASAPIDAGDPSIVGHPGGASGPVVEALPGWGPGMLPRLRRIARSEGIPLVHIQYQAAAYRLRPWVLFFPWWAARLGGPATVFTYHDLRPPYLFPKAGGIRTRLLHLPARTADASIVTNPEDLASLAAAVGTPRGRGPRPGVGGVSAEGPPGIRLIPIGSNLVDAAAAVAPAAFGLGASRIVAYFGLANPAKGILELVEALARLARDGRDLRLLVIGGGVGASDATLERSGGEVLALGRRLGIEDRIHVTGHLPAAEAAGWLRRADVVALPYRDGASTRRGSLMAAWRHGAAVVSTTPSTAGALAVPADAGLFVPPLDVTMLAGAIARVLDDRDLADQLRQGALRAAEGHRWQGICAEHAALYEAILGRRQAPISAVQP